MGMEDRFLSYIIKLTSFLALAAFFLLGVYQSFFDALGILVGAAWGITNIYFLKKTIQECLKLQSRDNWKLIIFIQLKFPILYLVGYGIFRSKLFSDFALIAGFSLIFIAIFLLGLAKVFLDRTKSKLDSNPL